jgi:hypothetical protein
LGLGPTFVFGPFPVPTGGGVGGGGLRIGPFSFSFSFGGKMPPTIPGIHCCRDDLRPPKVVEAIIKWLFSDYVDDPGDASNTISQGLRGPYPLLINPGTVGAQMEVAIADTNVATAILRGVKLADLGLAPGAHVVITQTVYSEMLRADGVVKAGLDKALERAQIEVRSVSLDALKSVGKELRALVPLGSLPLGNNKKLGSQLADHGILAEAKALNLPIVTMNVKDFVGSAKGGGKLADRLGVRIIESRIKVIPKELPYLSTITKKIIQGIF